jgi:hypothetical protein
MAAQLKITTFLDSFEKNLRYIRSVTFPERMDDRESITTDFHGVDFRTFGANYKSYLSAAGMGWLWRKVSGRSKQVAGALKLCSLIAMDMPRDVQKRLVGTFLQTKKNFRADSIGRRAVGR